MPNVVIDASIIASAALKDDSVPERAVLAAVTYDSLYLSKPILEDIREVLERPKFEKYITEERRTSIIALLLASAHFVTPLAKVTACRDSKDDKYLELAVAAQASFIVTGDKDLLSMSPWQTVQLVNPAITLRGSPNATACRRPAAEPYRGPRPPGVWRTVYKGQPRMKLLSSGVAIVVST